MRSCACTQTDGILMRRILTSGLVALFVLPAAATAQEHGGRAEHDAEHSEAVASVTPLYNQFKGWFIGAAEQMPEPEYSFSPTVDVRSFGQIVGHVASASYLFCSSAQGEENPSSSSFEELTSKTELVAELKKAFAYCDRAYEMSDSKAMEQTTFFGQENTRLWVLIFNATHNAEHYGNLVTYLRLKGHTPPSSQN